MVLRLTVNPDWGTLLIWVGRIFYAVQKGLNEIIAGLSSIDERLARLEDKLGRAE